MYELDVTKGKRNRINPKWYQTSYPASYEREIRKTIIKI
jgi:hypothetical protein